MSRSLVICLDGTSNQFGWCISNIVRVAQVAGSVEDRLVYYHPGVGTMPEPSAFSRMEQAVSVGLGLAFGRGLQANIIAAYRFLMRHHEPGDSVYIFGFSRGAYTARVLAAVLHQVGLLRPELDDLVPYAVQLTAEIDDLKGVELKRRWGTCDDFRASFARPGLEPGRRFSVHFLGLFDTVSSVGWVWEPSAHPYTARNPSVRHVRHAISLDERRSFFRQNRWSSRPGPTDVSEVWFPGVHSDIGGGYPPDGADLWRISLDWMLAEAASCGLEVEPEVREAVVGSADCVRSAWEAERHESLAGWMWKLAEYFPKQRYDFARDSRSWVVGQGRPRVLRPTDIIHGSVLHRVREGIAKHPSLPDDFAERLAGASELPSLIELGLRG